jgi:hypothetical protein
MNMGLVMMECAKPNECSDRSMPKVHSMCPVVA